MRAANQRVAVGENVLRLEVGEPGTPAPQAVLEAAQKAITDGQIGYTDALGLQSLRERIALYYGECYGLDLSPDRVVVTTGASGAFVLSFLAAFEPGDRIALVSPGYPAYRQILEALGNEAVVLEAQAETRYQPSADMIRSQNNLQGLLVASPANPTGSMLKSHELEELLSVCHEKKIHVISDEIYHGITYGEPANTALEYSDDVIVINSFSKYFSMTGWRIGWMVVPDTLIRTIDRLTQSLFISSNKLSQLAATAAFDAQDDLEAYVSAYAENRASLLRDLRNGGITDIAPPDGAFYLYANVSDLTSDSDAFCKQMLNEINVASTPGIDFDAARGHQTVRFSFAGPNKDIREAGKRLVDWLASMSG